jgi:hypothetical protein
VERAVHLGDEAVDVAGFAEGASDEDVAVDAEFAVGAGVELAVGGF